LPISETLFGYALVAVLLGLAAAFGWRQARRLRELRSLTLPEDEMAWERRKAWRRLVSAGLLGLMAALFVGQLVWWEPASQRLIEQREQLAEADRPDYTPEEKFLVRVWAGSWVVLLVLLLAIVALAGVDLWATRVYGLRQFRKLQADRRAMIERQATRLRHGRNGHG
jgi:hypothetical protein